jgi:hypothetical protein
MAPPPPTHARPITPLSTRVAGVGPVLYLPLQNTYHISQNSLLSWAYKPPLLGHLTLGFSPTQRVFNSSAALI